MAIGIVDVGIGNIGSLQGALYGEGWDTELVRSPDLLGHCDHLILPGVGSFYNAMRLLEEFSMVDAIREYAKKGKPILGICLGMQLLADCGAEGGGRKGLGLIEGQVRELSLPLSFTLPHVGWNTVEARYQHKLFDGIRAGVDFYFVHSYFFDVSSLSDQMATTDYGNVFTSCVARANVVGVQFHPEKSQRNGLKLLDNFCRWDGHA